MTTQERAESRAKGGATAEKRGHPIGGPKRFIGEGLKFAPRLRALIAARPGLSMAALAHQVGLDPSTVTGLHSGRRMPGSRDVVLRLARGLRCKGRERDELLLLAGFVPECLVRLGRWPRELDVMAHYLLDLEAEPLPSAIGEG